MIVKGTYTFRQNGVEQSHTNLITTAGKGEVLRYLAGQRGRVVQSIALGIGSQAATLTDTTLQFEVYRVPVDVAAVDFAAQKVIYKATLPPDLAMVIYEAGAWTVATPSSETGSRVLFMFDSAEELWTGGTWVTSGVRVGADALRLSAAASTTTTGALADFMQDFSGFSDTDRFSLAYNPADANTSSIKLRLNTDATNYYEYTISAPTAGYKFATFTKTNFASVGAPSWANITSANILLTATAGGTAAVDFDALRIDDQDFEDPESILVSRTVPGTQVVKTGDGPMDIEYVWDVTI